MNEHLQKWAESFASAKSRRLIRTIRVDGVRNAHLGPRMDFARVEFLVEPAEDLDVVVQVPGIEASVEHRQYVESAVYGFFDVLMMAVPYPVRNMKVIVLGAEFDPINSSVFAFRLAGRSAAMSLLEEIRTDPIY